MSGRRSVFNDSDSMMMMMIKRHCEVHHVSSQNWVGGTEYERLMRWTLIWSLYRRFPDNHFPGQTFPRQDVSLKDVSRTRRFPGNHFPGQTFPGQVILRNFYVH